MSTRPYRHALPPEVYHLKFGTGEAIEGRGDNGDGVNRGRLKMHWIGETGGPVPNPMHLWYAGSLPGTKAPSSLASGETLVAP